MKPAQPLPTAVPFLSLYTPTFRRPTQLRACLESVGRQTAVEDLEQIVVPDHVGYGVAGSLFGRLPWYASALRGRYVNLLCDDDVLASETVVETVRAFAAREHEPEVIVAKVIKNGLTLPACNPEAEPICGQVDLTSYIVRGDVWQRHYADYGSRYEGDYDHALKLFQVGYRFAFCDVLWAVGAASNGRPEVAA